MSRIIHLTASGVSLILSQEGDDLPAVVHWGSAIDVEDDQLRAWVEMNARHGMDPETAGVSDAPYRASLLPEHARGWAGRPGLALHRGGAGWAPRLSVTHVRVAGDLVRPATVVSTGASSVVVSVRDDQGGFSGELEIDLLTSGLVRARACVRNDDPAGALEVGGLSPALPVPTYASEMFDFAGRWGFEKIPQRQTIGHGVHARESRRGRTGLDATTVMVAGVPGFTAGSGEVWMGHVAASGNHEHTLERTDGTLLLRGGELLFPGEVRLAAGERYRSPWLYGSYGDGLDRAAARFHAQLRSLSRSSLRPRPVTLNVWEAVYFDHRHEVLVDLAERAAALGVERFVLDDGWFRGRRDDRAGLGDWTPDPAVWPRGLRPLADAVRSLGMEFGLWVEPEMINEDSDLARAHPDWILRARAELPPAYRFQQVLDLTHPDAFAHILSALDTLIREVGVAALKWDHNRDLVAAGHPATGAAAVHEQTLAVYRLMDRLRELHPHLEIESCASGGGRVDLGILERTDRIHTSDNHDPLDRARALRWTGLLVPPEMLGSHVASPTSSVTGRTHDLHLRCATAFIGHFGVEWDIRELSDEEARILAGWIADYTRVRGTISTGRMVCVDGEAASLRGVVAADRSEAVYTITTGALTADTSARIRLPGLDASREYQLIAKTGSTLGPPWQVPGWLQTSHDSLDGVGGPVLSGSLLSGVGLDVPTFLPERAIVVRALSLTE